MKLYRTNFTEAVRLAGELAEQNAEGLILADADSLGFAVGRIDNTCNREQMQSLGGVVYEGVWNGGTCVVFPNDISVCLLTHQPTDLGLTMLLAVSDLLTKRGLTVRIDGNDLMLTDKGQDMKVGSYAFTQLPNRIIETVVHISVGMDKDIIEQVCTKAMHKPIGKGLGDYGITSDEIVSAVLSVSPVTAANDHE